VMTTGPSREPVEVTRDETPRRDTSLEALRRLRPAFKSDGRVTAGNAPGVNDGAAALVVTSAERAAQLGRKPMARIVAQAVAGQRDRVFIATRVLPSNASYAGTLRACEASLRRLGVERIDLYQFHWPDETGTPVEDSWGEMGRLVEEGKVRWAGVSNFDVPLLERCEKIRHVDSLQPPFSTINRQASAGEIPWCAEHGTDVIIYSPMQSGLLTEKWTVDRAKTLAPDDWRRHSPDFQSPNLEKNLALRDALTPIAKRHGTTIAAIAVAWTLAWRGVTGAIVGARSPEQVDGWIGAASIELTGADLDKIVQAIERTGAGVGPKHPRGIRGL